MPVYVDALRPCKPWGGQIGKKHIESCHLFADTLQELHDFAGKIGLEFAWFQTHRRKDGTYGIPHYDLTPGKHNQAIKSGAILLSDREAVAKWKEIER